MKKAIIFLLAGLCVNFLAISQKSEYRYMALKFGASHGFNPTPEFNANKYALAPGYGSNELEEMQLSPVKRVYVPGFVFDFLYHFDFTTDNAGIYTGLEYNLGGIGANYETTFAKDDNTMKETFRYHSVGIPLAFKYGPDMFETQRYVYAGVQYNYIIAMSSVQKANWSETKAGEKVPTEAFNHTALNLFLGVNYLAFNVQLDYYPKGFFNEKYINEDKLKPYLGQPGHSFVIKTSINVPYGWLSAQSFWWRKILRNTFWK